jgi:hypothetical protein
VVPFFFNKEIRWIATRKKYPISSKLKGVITARYVKRILPIREKCAHMGCVKYGFSMEEPFITPIEYIRMGKDLDSEEALENAKKTIVKFFDFYDSKGNLLPWVVKAVSQEEDKKTTHVKVAPPI